MLVQLAVVLCAWLPEHSLVVEDYVEILEINTVYGYVEVGDLLEPRERLTQIGGLSVNSDGQHWEWWRMDRRTIVVGDRMIFHDDGVLRALRFGSLRHTWTNDWDPEILDREKRPPEMRRGLTPAKPTVPAW